MELIQAIVNRRTIRDFEPELIADDIIKELVMIGIYAPSACNRQAWKFISVTHVKWKEELVKYGGSDIITKAPNGILVLYRNDVSLNYRLYKDHYQSASAVIQNILLQAYEKGLGACWICDLPRPKLIRKIFNIPRTYDVIAYIALGYPKTIICDKTIKHFSNDFEIARKRERKYNIEQVFSKDSFGQNYEVKGVLRFVFLKSFFNKRGGLHIFHNRL